MEREIYIRVQWKTTWLKQQFVKCLHLVLHMFAVIQVPGYQYVVCLSASAWKNKG